MPEPMTDLEVKRRMRDLEIRVYRIGLDVGILEAEKAAHLEEIADLERVLKFRSIQRLGAGLAMAGQKGA